MPIRGSRRPNVVPITAPSFSTSPRPYVYRKIAYVFIALTIAIVGAVLWLSSVHAEVNVHVKKETVSIDSVVEVARVPQAGQISGRILQGTIEQQKEFPIQTADASSTDGTDSQPVVPTPPTPVISTLTTTTDAGVARGTVRIISKLETAQTLIKTTRLLTSDNKLFRIDKNVTIPANGQATVGVYADQPGSEYAIAPTQFTIPGLRPDLQKLVYAVSDNSFTVAPVAITTPTPPPIVQTVPPPSSIQPSTPSQTQIQADDDIVREQAMDQIEQTFASQIGDVSGYEPVFFVNEDPTVLPGSSPDSFVVDVKLSVTAVYYPKDDMLVLVRSMLKDKVPSDAEVVPFDNDSITYDLESVDAKNEIATLRVRADAEYQLTATSPDLQNIPLTGRSKTDVINQIEALDGVDSVEVVTHPGWLSKLPSLKDHITLNVN